MKIDIKYTARDGRSFNDPYKCEDYEKTLGVIEGSVRDVVIRLKRLPQDYLVNVTFVIWNEDRKMADTHHFLSVKLPDGGKIPCYLNKAVDFLESIGMPDAPCQYMGTVFESFDSKDSYLLISCNPDLMTKLNSKK